MKRRRQALRPGDTVVATTDSNAHAQNSWHSDITGYMHEGKRYLVIACRATNEALPEKGYKMCYLLGHNMCAWVLELYVQRVDFDRRRRENREPR